MTTINQLQTFQVISCGECHARFALSSSHYHVVYSGSPGTKFWCPVCGSKLSYNRKSDLKIERERRERAEASLGAARDQRDAAERSLTATKGHLTRQKKRVAAGVCPCCDRSFVNLARHMAGQHPEYAGKPKEPTDA